MSDVRELLQRLADEAPSGDEVLRGFPDIVYGTEPQLLRRPTWLPVLAAAAAGVLVIAGVVLSMSWSDSTRVSSDPPSAQQLVVPGGMRPVGSDGVYLAVPTDWATISGGCPHEAQADSVSFFPASHGVCPEPMPSHTTVTFSRLSTDSGWLSQMEPAVEQGGLSVRRTIWDAGTGDTVSALAIKSADLLLVVVSPHEGVREQILDSVAAIPEGWTAVPTNSVGTLEDVTSRLEAAGLEVIDDEVPPEWSPDVRAAFAYFPSPGDVLEVGSTVTIREPPGSCVNTGFCPPPQLNVGHWTPGDAGMQALMTGVLAFDETSNCAYIAGSEGGGGYEVVWPKGWSAIESAEGPQVLDRDGNVVATAGQEISAPGGRIGPAPSSDLTCSAGTGEVFHVQGEVAVTG
jgi:hypothetical protein